MEIPSIRSSDCSSRDGGLNPVQSDGSTAACDSCFETDAEAVRRRVKIATAKMAELRKTMGKCSVEEIISAKNEGLA